MFWCDQQKSELEHEKAAAGVWCVGAECTVHFWIAGAVCVRVYLCFKVGERFAVKG